MQQKVCKYNIYNPNHVYSGMNKGWFLFSKPDSGMRTMVEAI